MAQKAKTGDAPGVDRPITRRDIEDRVRSIQTDIESVKDSASGLVVIAAIAVAVALVVLAFAFGRRRGKAKYAFIEVRRA